MKRGFLALALTIAATSNANAADRYDPFTRPYDQPDLIFAPEPGSFLRISKNVMFKPEGMGPFPAIVIMPMCSNTIKASVWARGAVEHGYVVLMVDPMSSRGISSNCSGRPLPLAFGRQLEDAFDAAEFLRRQPFVDPAHVGLMGFSQGGMVGLAAAGATYSQAGGRKSFGAVVSVYPICIFRNAKHPFDDRIVDIDFVPDKFVVPILVEMGDQDSESGELMNGCPQMLDAHKALNEPIDYKIYQAGHVWDLNGPREVTDQSAQDAFAFLDAHLKGP